MKKMRKSSRQSNQGYALLITVVFIGIALLLLGSVMDWSNSSAKQTMRNNLYSSALAAAEAADENLMAHMWVDFKTRNLGSVASYETYLPNTTGWPINFSFSNGNGVANQTGLLLNGIYTKNFPAPVFKALGWQYRGLNGWIYYCTAVSTATAQNQPYSVPATVSNQFQLVNIPLCQFAIFYNMNMEICPGADMNVNGPTYVNGQIYADPGSGDTLKFGGNVNTTMDSVIYSRSPDDQQSSTANPDVEYYTDTSYTATNSPITDSPALVLPVGTNSFQLGSTNGVATNNAASVAAILQLPPSGTDPNSQLGQEYLYNQASLIISNSASGNYANSNITAYVQDPNNTTRLTQIPYNTNTISSYLTTNGYTTNYTTNVTSKTKNGKTTYTTNITVSGTSPITSTAYNTNWFYSFATNTSFYDYREGKTVQAVQLNVGALNSWINGAGSTYNTELYNDTGQYIDSVYIYNNAPSTSTSLPSVRVANGSVLPSQGLSVVTPDPLYVLGNYNATGAALGTTNTASSVPAALMADAVTILSTSWSDSWNASTSLNTRNAGSTTVDAATLEGIVESTKVGSTKYYSGGVENFLRLLENWSGDTLTYNGSIVVMFDSLHATNFWQTPGNYYNPPTRKWGFDVKYSTSQNNLPPIFPSAPVMLRQQWSAN